MCCSLLTKMLCLNGNLVPMSSKLLHSLLLVLVHIIAQIVSVYAKPSIMIKGIVIIQCPKFDSNTNSCSEYQIYFRLMAALAIFYLVHAGLTMISEKVNNAVWILKLLIIAAMMFGFIYVPNYVVHGYVIFSIIIAVIFNLLQGLMMANLSGYIDTKKPMEGKHWMVIYFAALFLFVGLGITIVVFTWKLNIHGNCPWQKAFFFLSIIGTVGLCIPFYFVLKSEENKNKEVGISVLSLSFYSCFFCLSYLIYYVTAMSGFWPECFKTSSRELLWTIPISLFAICISFLFFYVHSPVVVVTKEAKEAEAEGEEKKEVEEDKGDQWQRRKGDGIYFVLMFFLTTSMSLIPSYFGTRLIEPNRIGFSVLFLVLSLWNYASYVIALFKFKANVQKF